MRKELLSRWKELGTFARRVEASSIVIGVLLAIWRTIRFFLSLWSDLEFAGEKVGESMTFADRVLWIFAAPSNFQSDVLFVFGLVLLLVGAYFLTREPMGLAAPSLENSSIHPDSSCSPTKPSILEEGFDESTPEQATMVDREAVERSPTGGSEESGRRTAALAARLRMLQAQGPELSDYATLHANDNAIEKLRAPLVKSPDMRVSMWEVAASSHLRENLGDKWADYFLEDRKRKETAAEVAEIATSKSAIGGPALVYLKRRIALRQERIAEILRRQSEWELLANGEADPEDGCVEREARRRAESEVLLDLAREAQGLAEDTMRPNWNRHGLAVDVFEDWRRSSEAILELDASKASAVEFHTRCMDFMYSQPKADPTNLTTVNLIDLHSRVQARERWEAAAKTLLDIARSLSEMNRDRL